MDLRLEGTIALITGASAGIGRASAVALAAEGADVIIAARRGDALEETAAAVEAVGGATPRLIEVDLVRADAASRIADATGARMDVLVNAAGAAEPPGTTLTEDVWQRQFELNFHAKRRVAEAVLPLLRESGRGRIINFVGLLEPTVVSAAQAAVAACILWSKALARQVAAEGVTVNCIAPGRIDSEQVRRAMPDGEAKREFIARRVPAGRFGTPEEAAALVAFLASGPASYITGDTFSVDGGMHWSI